MNEFVAWCRHLLVSFLFHALTSLHPPSFHRNDFSTCSFIHFGAKPRDVFLRRAHVDFMHAHAHAENLHVHALASFSVSRGRATIGIYGERRTIAWCPCTPPSTMETFGGKISAEACSGKEIAGLLKKMMMMMMMKNMMTRKIV